MLGESRTRASTNAGLDPWTRRALLLAKLAHLAVDERRAGQGVRPTRLLSRESTATSMSDRPLCAPASPAKQGTEPCALPCADVVQVRGPGGRRRSWARPRGAPTARRGCGPSNSARPASEICGAHDRPHRAGLCGPAFANLQVLGALGHDDARAELGAGLAAGEMRDGRRLRCRDLRSDLRMYAEPARSS